MYVQQNTLSLTQVLIELCVIHKIYTHTYIHTYIYICQMHLKAADIEYTPTPIGHKPSSPPMPLPREPLGTHSPECPQSYYCWSLSYTYIIGIVSQRECPIVYCTLRLGQVRSCTFLSPLQYLPCYFVGSEIPLVTKPDEIRQQKQQNKIEFKIR